MAKVLAVDYGTKNIGLASGDTEFKIAFPRDVIENRGLEKVVKDVVAVVEEIDAELVVVGMPYSMREGQAVNEVKYEVEEFVVALGGAGIDCELVDERLSTFEAKSKTGRRDKVDAAAAQVILQRYFDSLV